MGLEKMLEYQKIDMGLYKLEKEYNQSKEIETSLKCKKMFEDRKENLQKLRSELDESLAMLDKIQEQVDVILAEKEWETYDVEKVNDLAELSELRKSLTKLEENYNNLSRTASKIVKRINEIEAENRRINSEMSELMLERKKCSAILDKKKEIFLEKAKPIARQLQAIKKELDEAMLKKYLELRNAKKMPAFVVYNAGNCGACGMDIAIEVGRKLNKSGDMAECPHCGRIVFVP